jgi:hypothetical protein
VSARRTENSGSERARHQPVNCHRSRVYASRVRLQYPARDPASASRSDSVNTGWTQMREVEAAAAAIMAPPGIARAWKAGAQVPAMNDAPNGRRPPNTSYNTIRIRCSISAMIKTCAIPPNLSVSRSGYPADVMRSDCQFELHLDSGSVRRRQLRSAALARPETSPGSPEAHPIRVGEPSTGQPRGAPSSSSASLRQARLVGSHARRLRPWPGVPLIACAARRPLAGTGR